jgi:thiol-disulfide isomerase/thioredoxin
VVEFDEVGLGEERSAAGFECRGPLLEFLARGEFAMVDSLSAPDWSDSPYCTRCRTEFSTFNRKHHCRATCAPLPSLICFAQASHTLTDSVVIP